MQDLSLARVAFLLGTLVVVLVVGNVLVMPMHLFVKAGPLISAGLVVGLLMLLGSLGLAIQERNRGLTRGMIRFAFARNFTHRSEASVEILPADVSLFVRSPERRVRDLVEGQVRSQWVCLLLFEYNLVSGRRSNWQTQMVAIVPGALEGVPDFRLEPRGLLSTGSTWPGAKHLSVGHLPGGKSVGQIYQLHGSPEQPLWDYLDGERLEFLALHPGWMVEVRGENLVVWRTEGLLGFLRREWKRTGDAVARWVEGDAEVLLEALQHLVPDRKEG